MIMSFDNSIRRVVPWCDRSEFTTVYQGLYSTDIERNQFAVDRIAVWKSRVLHKLPVAIESTANICRACILHQRSLNDGQVNRLHHQICNEYSMAIIRFVNHITEKSQNKQFAQPIHILASELGLPEWIVEIRHSATHGTMPSLEMLCAGSDWALNWLKKEFWEKQLETMPEIKQIHETRNDSKTVIYKALQEFIRTQLASFEKETGAIDEDKKKLQHLFSANKAATLTCLLEDGYLLSTRSQLGNLKIKIKNFDCLSAENFPKKLVLFWKPVLKSVHQLNWTPLLLKFLVTMVTEHLTLKNWLICGWIKTIIKCNDDAAKKKRKPQQLYTYREKLPRKHFLETLIRVPSLYTAPVIKFLMDKQEPPLDPRKFKKLTKLIDIYNSSSSSEIDLSQNIKTLEDIQSKLKDNQHSETVTGFEMLQSPWKLCRDKVDWFKYPIGALPPVENNDTTENVQSISFDEIEPTSEEDQSCESMEDETDSRNSDGWWTQTELTNIKNLVCAF